MIRVDRLAEEAKDFRVEAALEETLHQPDPVIATCVNAGYVNAGLAENWYRSLQRIGLEDRALVGALDDQAQKELERRGIPCNRWESQRHGPVPTMAVDYRRDGWAQIVFTKVAFVSALLAGGRPVLFADADVVFLEDPTPELQALDADFAIQSNVRADGGGDCDFGPQTTCSGFYLAQAVPAARRVLDLSGVNLSAYRGEQELVHERLMAADDLRLKVLPRARFPNGHYWQVASPLHPAAVHFNWIVGAREKAACMARSGLWLVDGRQP